jgi:hypothetical protein
MAAALVSLLLALTAPAAPAGPVIHVSARAPFTVRGVNFRPQERVRVVVRARVSGTRFVTATRRGVFLVRFRRIRLSDCDLYRVAATGNRGSRANRVVTPACGALP